MHTRGRAHPQAPYRYAYIIIPYAAPIGDVRACRGPNKCVRGPNIIVGIASSVARAYFQTLNAIETTKEKKKPVIFAKSILSNSSNVRARTVAPVLLETNGMIELDERIAIRNAAFLCGLSGVTVQRNTTTGSRMYRERPGGAVVGFGNTRRRRPESGSRINRGARILYIVAAAATCPAGGRAGGSPRVVG